MAGAKAQGERSGERSGGARLGAPGEEAAPGERLYREGARVEAQQDVCASPSSVAYFRPGPVTQSGGRQRIQTQFTKGYALRRGAARSKRAVVVGHSRRLQSALRTLLL